MKKAEPWGIVEMELRECKQALKKYLEDPQKQKPADKELMHVAAALVHMRAMMDSHHKKD